MPTVITHAVAASALTTPFPESAVSRRSMFVGAVCAMVPDLDVIGFRFGIHYGDLFGHRGFTHSILFAACLSTVLSFAVFPAVARVTSPFILWTYLFLATASHGLLDAFTNGGLGIAFFSPFDTTRYFFAVRPIQVSPIGAGFFSERGLAVLQSEFVWVWIPSIAFAALVFAVRHFVRRSRQPTTF